MYRLFYFIPIWIVMMIVRFPLVILGWFAVPVLLCIKRFKQGKEIIALTNTPVWGNKQDFDTVNRWYWEKHGAGFWAQYRWYAFRNPIHNFALSLAIPIDPGKVSYYGFDVNPFGIKQARKLGMSIWFLAWQGVYAGYWYIRPWNETRHFRFRIGWKIVPDDMNGVEGERARTGAVFGEQLMIYRKG